MAGLSTLLVAAGGTALVGATYAWVGRRLGVRRVDDPNGQRALRGFTIWWTAMASNQFLWAAINGASAFGFASLDAQITYAIVQRVLLAIALWGFVQYLLFVRTGRDFSVALGAFYALYLGAVLYSFHWSQPIGLHAGTWRVDLDFARQGPPIVQLVFFAALIVPPVGAAIAFATVQRRARDASQRWRIAATSWGIIVWWLLTVAAGAPRSIDVGWLQALNRMAGLVAAVAILLAYTPPVWVTRRFGVEPYGASR